MKKLIFIMIICCILTGCKSVNIYKENSNNTKVVVTLKSDKDKNLANEICDSTEKNFEIVVDIKEKEKGERYRVALTKENNYEQVVYLPDGNYKFNPGWTLNNDNEIIINISDAVINKSNKIDEISLTLREESVRRSIENTIAKKEILEADINSGKVQYRGKIYTLPSTQLIKDLTKGEEVGKSVEPFGTKEYFDCVVYNPKATSEDISKCEVIGINTADARVILPKGVQPYTTYSSVVEKIGNPSKMDGFAVIFPKEIDISAVTELEVDGIDDKTVYKLTIESTSNNVIKKVYYEHR